MAVKKQKNFRIDADIETALADAVRDFGIEEAEIARRALRYYIRAIRKDKDVLLSKDAFEPLGPSPSQY